MSDEDFLLRMSDDEIRDYFNEQSYQEWYNNYDENNPYQLRERNLISDDDLIRWLEKDRIEKEKEAKMAKRKKVANQILNIV